MLVIYSIYTVALTVSRFYLAVFRQRWSMCSKGVACKTMNSTLSMKMSGMLLSLCYRGWAWLLQNTCCCCKLWTNWLLVLGTLPFSLGMLKAADTRSCCEKQLQQSGTKTLSYLNLRMITTKTALYSNMESCTRSPSLLMIQTTGNKELDLAIPLL